MVYLIPGDAAVVVAGEGATTERIAEVRHQLGLDDSFIVQFGRWIGGVVHGDFGRSIVYHTRVIDIIGDRVSVSASLVVVGLFLGILIGIPAGIAAGTRSGSWIDRVVTGITTLGIAIPAFWVAMLLIIVFAIQAGIFPATGYVPLATSVGGWAKSMVLPGLAIAAASAADIARQTRSSVAQTMSLEHVRTNRAMGFKPRSIVFRHVLRNSGVPIVTVTGVQVERLLSAAVVIEIMFAMPGIGPFMVASVQSKDLPAIQGCVLVIAVAVILTNLIVDLSYSLINPRLKVR